MICPLQMPDRSGIGLWAISGLSWNERYLREDDTLLIEFADIEIGPEGCSKPSRPCSNYPSINSQPPMNCWLKNSWLSCFLSTAPIPFLKRVGIPLPYRNRDRTVQHKPGFVDPRNAVQRDDERLMHPAKPPG